MDVRAKQRLCYLNRSRSEFLDIAFDVARRLKDFDSYGGSKRNACKAIARRCDGLTSTQCEIALEKAILLYDTAEELVEKHKEKLWQTYNKPEGLSVGNILCAELKASCPGFKLSTYRSAISWLFFWHHLK